MQISYFQNFLFNIKEIVTYTTFALRSSSIIGFMDIIYYSKENTTFRKVSV
jgi:hypothetical protein